MLKSSQPQHKSKTSSRPNNHKLHTKKSIKVNNKRKVAKKTSHTFSTTMADTVKDVAVSPAELDLKTYREYFVSTTTYSGDAAALYTSDVVLSDFFDTVSPFETKKWPNKIRFNTPAKALPSLADNLMHQIKSVYDQIGALKAEECTLASTLMALEIVDRKITPFYAALDWVADVHPEKDIRDASNEAKERLSEFFIKQSTREDIFIAVKHFSKTPEAQGLEGEYKLMLDDQMRDFRRMGLELPADKKDQFIQIKTKLSQLEIKFSQNLGEEDTKFEFSKDQLKGMSDEMLKALKFDEEKSAYIVSLKPTDFLPIMKYCHTDSTRKAIEKAYNSRCIESNAPIIEEIVKLRLDMSKMLGYNNYADYSLDVTMAKTQGKVQEFLDDLNARLTPLYQKDTATLLAAKKRTFPKFDITLGEGVTDINDPKIEVFPHERTFLANIVEVDEYALDQEEVKQFFELEHVTQELITIYSEIFGLKFVEQTPAHFDGNTEVVVDKDVKFFNIYDTSGIRKDKNGPIVGKDELYGQAYIDNFPRTGKYNHFAVWPLVGTYVENGKRSAPVAGLVCNFPRPTDTTPSLLNLDQVVTYAHEAGHLIHSIVSTTELQKYAGTSVRRDFVELPSQLLENVMRTPKYLNRMMKHWKTGEAPSQELVDKIVKVDKCLTGNFHKRQLVFGITDQRLHTKADGIVDTAAVYKQTMKDVMGIEPTPGTNMIASFGHLASSGYAAGYYGYEWALSLSYSAWDHIEKNGHSTEIWRKYRTDILQNGGAIDPNTMLVNFIGKEPTNAPFLKAIGLDDEIKQ